MPAKSITDAFVRGVRPPLKTDRPNQIFYIDTLETGLALVLVVSYGGSRTFRALTYRNGRPHTRKIGRYPDMTVKAARAAAREYFLNPEKVEADAAAGSFKDVAEGWFDDHVIGGKQWSAPEIRRHLEKYVYPAWKDRPFIKIRRPEVSALLDEIAKKNGRPQADAVLATVRSIMQWQQSRDEHYISPIVKGMKKDKRKPDEKQRDRTLTDTEIKDVWEACDRLGGSFAGIVKLALLTGQRRSKVAGMRWSDVDADGIWTVATEPGQKGTAERVRLPPLALSIIEAQPKIAGNDHVFAARTRKAPNGFFNSWSERKEELDALLPKTMSHWTVHDLRRTTRTTMAELGILDHIAERTIGHKLQGMMRVYNRHPYHAEKADALAKVAAHIDTILNPPADNVVHFAKTK